MEDTFQKLAGRAADAFMENLTKDVIDIATAEKSNLEAVARAIAHVAVAYSLLEFVAGDLPVPTELIFKMGEDLGKMQAKSMKSELKGEKAFKKANAARGEDPIVKNAWRNQL